VKSLNFGWTIRPTIQFRAITFNEFLSGLLIEWLKQIFFDRCSVNLTASGSLTTNKIYLLIFSLLNLFCYDVFCRVHALILIVAQRPASAAPFFGVGWMQLLTVY